MKIIPKCIKTKRHLCASGSILLPLAQKWGLVGVVVICGLSLIGAGNVSAASITLTVSPKPITFSITPSPDGTFGKSTAGTIKITTDALAGYTLSIKSQNGADLVHSTLKDNKIVSISKDVTESDFQSKKDYNNMWGFAYYQQNASNLTFHPGPDNDKGTVIGTSKDPNSSEETYNVVLGARIGNALPTGEYSNTFIVTASANPVPYTITYDDNTEDTVTGMPTGGEQKAETETFALPEDEPKRNNFTFIGWCTTKPTSENNIDKCGDGNFYKPGDNFTLTSKDQVVALHAVWAKTTQVMQNWDGCDSLDSEMADTLVDIRDGNIYTVAKLKDAVCWMTQNLRLGDDKLKNRTLTYADSDIADNGKFTMPASDMRGFNEYDKAFVYIDSNFGGYYSWFAATAGSGTKIMEPEADAKSSICPNGWRLPSKTQIENLINSYGGTGDMEGYDQLLSLPANFVHSGYMTPSVLRGSDSDGIWWGSTNFGTVGNEGRSYYLVINESSRAYLSREDRKGSAGFQVRCIARE